MKKLCGVPKTLYKNPRRRDVNSNPRVPDYSAYTAKDLCTLHRVVDNPFVDSSHAQVAVPALTFDHIVVFRLQGAYCSAVLAIGRRAFEG